MGELDKTFLWPRRCFQEIRYGKQAGMHQLVKPDGEGRARGIPDPPLGPGWPLVGLHDIILPLTAAGSYTRDRRFRSRESLPRDRQASSRTFEVAGNARTVPGSDLTPFPSTFSSISFSPSCRDTRSRICRCSVIPDLANFLGKISHVPPPMSRGRNLNVVFGFSEASPFCPFSSCSFEMSRSLTRESSTSLLAPSWTLQASTYICFCHFFST